MHLFLKKCDKIMWDCNNLFSFHILFSTNSVCQHYCGATVCPASHCCQTCQSVTPRHRGPAAFNTLMSEPLPISHYYLPCMMTQEFILWQNHQQQFNRATVSSLMQLHINPKTVMGNFIQCGNPLQVICCNFISSIFL